MESIKKLLQSRSRKKRIQVFINSDPDKLAHIGEKALIPAFSRATKMPAYAGLLKAKNIRYSKIKSVKAFKTHVPIFQKKDIFTDFDISTLCVGGNLDPMKWATTSCGGTSGLCSVTMNTKFNQQMITESVDTSLEYLFQTDKKKTFVLSCLPMGVKLPTSLPMAETSVRSDMALSIIKKLSHHFNQTLIVGFPSFIKKLIEEGIDQGINFKEKNVSLLLTEDWFSESFRRYIAQLIGINCQDKENGLICATMGVSELGFNLFHETFETINIRQKLQHDPSLMKKLFGKEIKACPAIYQYYPNRLFLETTSGEELVFSILDKHFLTPLIRYNSKETGFVFSYNQIKKFFQSESLSELIPQLKLPIVAIQGRSHRNFTVKGKNVSPEEIQQGLYSFPEAAGYTTGFFRLSYLDEKKKNGQIEIQLKKNVPTENHIKKTLTKALLSFSAVDLKIRICNYYDFPYALEVDYEQNFSSI